MADENDDVNNDDDKAPTLEEMGELIKAQQTRIGELETDAATHQGLQAEVAKLQETLGTQTSLTELVEQLKTMNSGSVAQTESEKHANALQDAADNGNMKEFRRLRKQSA